MSGGSGGSTGHGPAALDVTGLAFTYPGGEAVLRDLALSVAAGERLGIIGPSGAGKTTLLLHLNGILLPQAGAITVDGVPVGRETAQRIREWVGLVFQDPDDQLFTPTVGEDVAFGPRNLGMEERAVEQRVTETLEALEMAGMAGRHSHRLSYGERRRAALATVLIMRPRLVALDEPFANLSPSLVERLIAIIRGLPATVVIVSQSILPLLSVCDRIAVLAEGRVQAVGPTAEILRDRALLQRYGLDFTFYLDSARRLGL